MCRGSEPMVTRAARVALMVSGAMLLISPTALPQSSGYKIVVNAANPTSSLSKAQISSLFLHKTATWDSGEPVQPIDQGDASPVRETFWRDLGVSASAAQQA